MWYCTNVVQTFWLSGLLSLFRADLKNRVLSTNVSKSCTIVWFGRLLWVNSETNKTGILLDLEYKITFSTLNIVFIAGFISKESDIINFLVYMQLHNTDIRFGLYAIFAKFSNINQNCDPAVCAPFISKMLWHSQNLTFSPTRHTAFRLGIRGLIFLSSSCKNNVVLLS